MLTLPLDSIRVAADRQRQAFDDGELQTLAASIERRGLLHAIVVRPAPSDGRLGGWILVAGERRLRAIRDLCFLGKTFTYEGEAIPTGHIPATDIGDLDELAREEAEYDENVKRADLTWPEEAQATARLASIRNRQADAAGAERPTVAALAEERKGSSEGVHHQTTRRELIVAQHLDDPEVRASRSLDDAFKLLQRRETAQKSVALAAEVGRTFTAKLHQAFHAESLGWLSENAAEQFDIILTDPPYGMGADAFGDSNGIIASGAHGYVDSYESWQELMRAFTAYTWRVTKPQAHTYIFCDIDRFHELKALMQVVGWWVHRTPIVWHKPGYQRVPWPEHGPQRKYELILYAVKGKRPVTKTFPDVVSYNPDDNMGHGAQKPVALFVDLLKRSAKPGDKVLDPFAGSGPIFPACHELKCIATGIEQDAAYYGLCLKRLDELSKQGEMPL